MRINSYLVPTKTGTRTAWGTPLRVWIHGAQVWVYYQFPGEKGGQTCGVVHPASGRMVAPIRDGTPGTMREQAQAACDKRLGKMQPATVWHTWREAEVLNP